jgi:hypothetical protein
MRYARIKELLNIVLSGIHHNKFIASRYATFNEFAISYKENELNDVVVEMDQATSKQVELKIKVSEMV